MSQIFISYKRADKEKVFELKDKIEAITISRCWVDLDFIESDAFFANVIIKAIDEADVFLFMYSKQHTKIKDYEDDWTIREINYAQKSGKKIVFVNLDGTPLTNWFEFMFGLKQQVDAQSKESFNHLLQDINKWLGTDKSKTENHNEQGAEDYYVQAKKEYNLKNYSEALKLFTLAAQKGHVLSQYNLGVMYSKGQGIPKNNYESLKWYTEAAINGDINAQYSVGIRYEKGIGTPPNTSLALKWIRLAAEKGYSKAQLTLAAKFYYGNGVRRNYQAAYKWYTKSAEQGNMDAQRMVANMSEYGVGVVSNIKTAIYWYEKLAKRGDKYAKDKIEELKRRKN